MFNYEGKTSGIKNFMTETFLANKWVKPNQELVYDFFKQIKSFYAQIDANIAENNHLTKQRDELLPLLMNGQVSVNYHLSVLEVGTSIGKYLCAASYFYPRLAVSKWIAPRSFLMGGVLGFPNSFLVDIWRASKPSNK